MSVAVRLIAVLLIPLAVLMSGCGAKHNAATGGTGSDSQSIPADPSGDAGDAAGITESCPAQPTTSFAKTKFVMHSGLAFGVFHRWLWKPYQAGTFKSGANGRITAFIKGGLAALFIKREIRLASNDVQADPKLCSALIKPLAKVGDTVKAAFDKLKGGDASGVTDLNSTIGSIESTSQTDGVPIQEDENADITKRPA
ncbi:hypothetical protein A5784_26690 [Mycobacterium sp. 852013-50091_SCH5140682]|nr:hypothetical protein A5784_26690 [Mycobacterium sp. 852013-50091_SCH5140682]